MDKKKLGEALLKAKKISEEKLKQAYTMHEKIGGEFAPLLVKLGYVIDKDITEIMGKLEGIPTIDIFSLVIPDKLIQAIPRDVIEKHNVIPITKKEGQLTLAMADINDFAAIEKIQFLTGCRVEPVLASRDGIRKRVIEFYSQKEEKLEKLDKQEKTFEDFLESAKSGKIAPFQLQKALILLLIEKKVISGHELTEMLDRIASKP